MNKNIWEIENDMKLKKGKKKKVNYVRVGRNLKRARTKTKMTQAMVADALDISPSYYSNLERGADCISLERLVELCTLFNVKPGDILNDCCDELMLLTSTDLQDACKEREELKLLIAKCPDSRLRYLKAMWMAACEMAKDKGN